MQPARRLTEMPKPPFAEGPTSSAALINLAGLASVVFAGSSQAVGYFIRGNKYAPHLVAIVEVCCIAVPADAVYTLEGQRPKYAKRFELFLCDGKRAPHVPRQGGPHRSVVRLSTLLILDMTAQDRFASRQRNVFFDSSGDQCLAGSTKMS